MFRVRQTREKKKFGWGGKVRGEVVHGEEEEENEGNGGGGRKGKGRQCIGRAEQKQNKTRKGRVKGGE